MIDDDDDDDNNDGCGHGCNYCSDAKFLRCSLQPYTCIKI